MDGRPVLHTDDGGQPSGSTPVNSDQILCDMVALHSLQLEEMFDCFERMRRNDRLCTLVATTSL
ncbi:hypothetical protein Scep_018847 [Stephania cephalantha]|uniref:Uncharacterized protein n=1 Tax=Stephania cephalantha TaxID=152367 RepID=A0AAP0I9S5_9MAGN